MSQTKAILCVDDEEVVLNALSDQLSEFLDDDYIVEVADNSEHAYEIVDELKDDDIELALVISDYIMPNVRGDELLINIHKKFPDSLKMMLTGQADIDGMQNAINQAKLYRYMTKPWQSDDLELTIKEAIKSFEQNKKIKDYQKDLEDKIAQRTKELEFKNKQLSEYIALFKEYSFYSQTDTDGIITDVSDSFTFLSGYQKEQLIGQKHSILKSPDTDPKLYNELWDYITKGMAWHGELKNITSDGEEFWADTIIYPKLDEDQKVVGYTAARKDITDKKMIEQISITDPLTKLFNRRHFNLIFKNEQNRAKREDHNLIFMMMDIDHFKKYNDTYGHQIGDDTLISVAQTLQKVAHRANDFVFRLGGEEFAIVTSSMDISQINDFAKHINKAIEDIQIEHKNNSASPYVTISIGVCVVEPYMKYTQDDIIKHADDALYRVKEIGRNNYHIAKL
jgi:diguanylate cyclase (GGDEF)-like protein/PAS domain S-box-containing protein